LYFRFKNKSIAHLFNCFLILCVTLTITPSISLAQSWDKDGGFDADYSGIPRLTWISPDPPESYQDYISSRILKSIEVEKVLTKHPKTFGDRLQKVLILVNDALHNSIQVSLNIYVNDLANDGYTVEVHKISGGNPISLKSFILSNSTDLVGCLFVGDLPAAWFEMEYWGHEEFPCDLYYMDLDGTWDDADKDNIFDLHSAGTGDEGPEIYLGRVDASMMYGNETVLTNDYFDKNHNYRIGGITVPNFGLTYTEDDWASFYAQCNDIKYSYSDYEVIKAPATERTDYVDNRVPSSLYEFIQLSCHSSPSKHFFTRGGTASSSEIKNVVPYAMFYNLFCCSTLRFTTTDYLGGAYIYNSSQTSIAVIGSTKTGSMLSFHAFYKPFGNKETFGEAYRQWFNYLAPYSGQERAWHYGMTVAGDPFLTLLEQPLILKSVSGFSEKSRFPGPETSLTIEIKDGVQSYKAGSGLLHYRFDGVSAFDTVALNDLGGGLFEGVLPNTEPGDEPQFYFSAEGNGGAVINLPAGAPNDVFSFEVCFVKTFWEDDFENNKGWIVSNSNIQTGEWERADPEGTDAQPEDDHTANGQFCYVTGKEGGSTGNDDVDGGPTRLESPVIDLSSGDALFEFYLHFYHSDYGVQNPLTIELSNDNGSTWTKAADIVHTPNWNFYSYRVSDYVAPTDKVKIRLSAMDDPNDDIVEAALDDFAAVQYNYDASLWADAYSITVSTGGVVNYNLDCGSGAAGRRYLLLGSMSGAVPGFSLPGGMHVPINWDQFTSTVISSLSTPVFQDFLGTLDAEGRATAVLNTYGPVIPACAGLEAGFIFIMSPPPAWNFVSNVIPLTFDP